MSATTVSPRELAKPRATRERERPQLRVVRNARARHTLAYLLAIVVIISAAVFGAVSMNALAAASSVEARNLANQVTEAERGYAYLVAQVASLEDPGRIRQAALDLGLVPSGPARVIQLERHLPVDGAVAAQLDEGLDSDPLKPLLSAER